MVANQSGGKKYGDSKGQKGPYDAKKSSGICAYCKKPEHSIDKCFRIHDFPADFKFTKPKKVQGQVQANNVLTSNEEGEQGIGISEGKSLTLENVAQLLQLLQELKMG